MDVNIKVAIRCRPLNSKEKSRGCSNIIAMSNNSSNNSNGSLNVVSVTHLTDNALSKEFTFDHCYNIDSTHDQVYIDLGEPMVKQALEGFNSTLFAYGQTGSGKTYTMMGDMTSSIAAAAAPSSDSVRGIIPRLNFDLWSRCHQMSNKDTKFMITVSFLEIYNEIVKDLLNPSEKQLKIRENQEQGIYVEGLCELIVKDANDVMRLIDQGNTVRRVAATNMNEQSSRSHSVFTIRIDQKTETDMGNGIKREQIVKAKLNLVDLAGSERAGKTGASGTTLREGANINLSLMALGNVINALSEGKVGKKQQHIPYRDSKLTRLLQESLGGNSATCMLAAISPADYNFEETLSTLKYANRAKSIANNVTRNEDLQESVIRNLKEEIENLKKQVATGGGIGVGNKEVEEKLREMEAAKASAWEEKVRLSEALENERQANMSVAIGSMMQGIKEQKVTIMKNIKRLSNEKTVASKQLKEGKEKNDRLKKEIDSCMKEYQQKQVMYDEVLATPTDPSDTVKQEATAKLANDLIQLLSLIGNSRETWLNTRDKLTKLRDRLVVIDEEITEGRAELVTAAGVLDQNDRIREQIQLEEKAKAKEMIEEEVAKVRSEYQSEFTRQRQDEYDKHLKVLQSKLTESQVYIETLEHRITDAEVSQESLQVEVAALTQQGSDDKARIQELELLLQQESKDAKEEQQYSIFASLMDTFTKEKEALEGRYRGLLASAAEDIVRLMDENKKLTMQLQDALFFER